MGSGHLMNGFIAYEKQEVLELGRRDRRQQL
jgi:hypothetical protein